MMLVSVDSETKWSGEYGRQIITTLSFGREDGTSGSYHGTDAPAAYRWLFDQLAMEYTGVDGTTYRQVPKAFHFGHDTAVLANGLDFDKMFLVRKVQTRIRTALCGATHRPGEHCDVEHGETGLLHRYDTEDVKATLSDGIHSDLAAYDPDTNLAMCFGTGQGAYLELRPHGDRYDEWKRLVIKDTGRAFTGGLESVIAHWQPELTGRQKAAIAWGKRARLNGFAGATDQEIAEYSEAECVAHARVCRKLLDCINRAAHVPMRPDQLGGSGSIAAAVMKHYGVTKRRETHTEEGTDDLPLLDYFGGLIETPVVGLVQGQVDEEDINSAYPSRMIHLPCMRAGHGQWYTVRPAGGPIPQGYEVGHALVSWIVPGGVTSTPPFIVRSRNGRVSQPLTGRKVWVTLAELYAALERFPDTVFVHRIAYWDDECECPPPFEFLADLYNARLDTKELMALVPKGSPEWMELDDIQRTIKLIINSIYGKLAQTRPEPGPFTNLHYASYITGSTRAQVRRKAWEVEDAGGTVVYQHTDSVLSTGGRPSDGGSLLGAWGLEKPSTDFLIIQPGLAMSLGTASSGKCASRGAHIRDFTLAAWNWYQNTDLTQYPATWPRLVIEQDSMVSLRLAMARGKPHLAGSFEHRTTEINVLSRKRDYSRCTPLPGSPTAWIVPPVVRVEDPVTCIEDVRIYRSILDRRRRAGEFD